MNLKNIVTLATNKDKFKTIENYSDFCLTYLEFIQTNLQAVIISKNENSAIHNNIWGYCNNGTA